jgi:hypothetical protein
VSAHLPLRTFTLDPTPSAHTLITLTTLAPQAAHDARRMHSFFSFIQLQATSYISLFEQHSVNCLDHRIESSVSVAVVATTARHHIAPPRVNVCLLSDREEISPTFGAYIYNTTIET